MVNVGVVKFLASRTNSCSAVRGALEVGKRRVSAHSISPDRKVSSTEQAEDYLVDYLLYYLVKHAVFVSPQRVSSLLIMQVDCTILVKEPSSASPFSPMHA